MASRLVPASFWDEQKVGLEAARQLASDGRFEDALMEAGRNCGPLLLREWWECGLLTAGTLRELLPHVWAATEFPTEKVGVQWWVRAFKTAGFLGSSPPSESMTLFRGALPGFERRPSWTDDPDVARWFAGRVTLVKGPEIEGHLYRVEVPPRHVLAVLQDDSSERELVVNPHGLRSIVDLGPVAPHARVWRTIAECQVASFE